MATIQEIIDRKRADLDSLVRAHNDIVEELNVLRGQDAPDQNLVESKKARKDTLLDQIESARSEVSKWEAEKREDAEVERKQASAVTYRAGSEELEHTVTGSLTITERAKGDQWIRNDGLPAAVARGQRFADHPAVRAEASARSTADSAVMGTHGNLGQLVRAISTSGASAVVPTSWAGNIIDLARAKSATVQAGATVVPMDAKTLEIGRLTGDPTSAFRTEAAEITPSDPTFDNVTLTAKTMSTLVVGSLEWLQDSLDGSTLIEDAIAQSLAAQLDLVALYGGIETGAGSIDLESPPNPDGVLSALLAYSSAANVLGATAGVTATNGTTQTSTSFYNEVIDLVYKVKTGNIDPTGIIWSPRAEQIYAKAYDTTGQPLRIPEQIASIPRYTTTKIPTYTQGTLTTATDVFAGDWSQLLIGQRLDFTIQVLTERYAEFGQFGIVAHWRGDIALARPKAFAAYKALKGA